MQHTLAFIAFVVGALVGLWGLATWRGNDAQQRGNLACGSLAFFLLGVALL